MAKRNQSRPGRSSSKSDGRSKGPRKDADKKGFSPKRSSSRSSDDPTGRPKRSGPPKSSRGGFGSEGSRPQRSGNTRSRFSSGDESSPNKKSNRFQEGGDKRFSKRDSEGGQKKNYRSRDDNKGAKSPSRFGKQESLSEGRGSRSRSSSGGNYPPTKKSSRFEGGGDKRFAKRDDDRGEKKNFRNREDNKGERPASRFGKQSSTSEGRSTRPRSSSGDYTPIKKSSRFQDGDKKRFAKNEDSRAPKKPYQRRDDDKGEKPSRQFDKDKAQKYVADAPEQAGKIRLNRFIANSGVCSRREADELITMGLISVNGKTITELGYKVNPGDQVKYEDRLLKFEKPVYLLLNKPKGYLTTTSDPQERKTVMHLIANAVKERVYPVGRLDRNTTGLLLLTNDGELADKLMHPSYNAKKIYKVELDRPISKGDFQKLVEGVELEEGKAMVDDAAIVSDDGKTVGIELHIGWNRVVRRIFEALEYQVVKLDRSVYAGLDKRDLPRGHWRFLTKEEVVMLKHYR
jgi:23S rRNA pseudouridine2605 synthase